MNNEAWQAAWHQYIAICQYDVFDLPLLPESAVYGTIDNFNDEISTSIPFNGL